MSDTITMDTGYYWAHNPQHEFPFIVYYEDHLWFICGIEHPINFDPRHLISGPLDSPQEANLVSTATH